ncbi:hypothetical protein SAMN02745947_02763 [Rhodococcus rhodochrous J3]|uniref:Uncharacterized protein n=1 Tax=Rhodococcus rhodochrous J3 TaxID=903528 RepID=A0ABY1MBX5_RHORH|nr:hypothetical protein SAMN02745947_02763 [Rhodococcus rhodochrous J3]
MVGGAYWPETDEVAALEEQVGSHGGMGGPQSTPLPPLPGHAAPPPEPLKGAENVHEVPIGWRDLSSRPSTAATGHDATTRSGDPARME